MRERVLRAGAVSFLIKPFDGRKMIDCLRQAVCTENSIRHRRRKRTGKLAT